MRTLTILMGFVFLGWFSPAIQAAQTSPTPEISQPSGTYDHPLTVVLHVKPPQTPIRFSVDGTPVTAASLLYDHPIQLTDDTTLRVRSFQAGAQPSIEVAATYIINTGKTVARPVFSPQPGLFGNDQAVTITSATAGAVIRWTRDGSSPSESSALYVSPIALTGPAELRARAFKKGMFDSGFALGVYSFQARTPVITPAAGTYSSAQTISLATATIGASIRFSLDGSDVTAVSLLYTAPFPLDHSATVKARSFRDDFQPSDLAMSTFVINSLKVIDPSITPNGGNFFNDVTVTLASATPGAVVRYETDGSDPTPDSPIAPDPLLVNASGSLKAQAYLEGWQASEVVSAVFSFQVATPTLFPEAGTINGPIDVTADTITSGATLHFSTDGTIPNELSPIHGPINLGATTTVTVLGIRDGYFSSEAATATYEFSRSFPLVGFADSSLEINEGNGQADLRIVAGTATSGSIEVDYEIEGGTAQHLKDFEFMGGTISLPAGIQEVSLPFSALDDDIDEPEEGLYVRIIAVRGARLNTANSSIAVSINDNDEPPSVSFAQNEIRISESDGLAALSLVLSAASGKPITAYFQVIEGTLQSGNDYSPPPDRQRIAPSDSGSAIEIAVVDDSLPEAPEFLDVELTSADNATLGSRTRCRLWVVSNEAGNAVVAWFNRAETLVADTNTDPAVASRVYALLGVAQRRAVRELSSTQPMSVSSAGAVTAASWTVLAGLFPTRSAELRQQALDDVAALGWSGFVGEGVVDNTCLGRQIGLSELSHAAGDGSALIWTGVPPVGPGFWYASWSYAKPPLRPLWGSVRPWFLSSGDALRPGPPPAFGGAEFLAAVQA